MSTAPETIVLIHGLWMTPRSWEHWAARYEERGHTVVAPAWPGLEVEVEELNRDPSPIAELELEQIVDYYDEFIRRLESPPIIIGHSIGGAVTQVLVDRGLGSAAVGIASATVKGILDLPFTTLKASSPVLRNPFNRGKAIALDAKQFHYAFANTLSQEESDEIYTRYHVPAAASVLFDIAFANLHRHPITEIDFERDDRAPLLFIAFDEDHIVPANASRHNAEKYEKSSAVTEFKEFDGRPHFPGAPGWEEVADFALDWATGHARAETTSLAAAAAGGDE
jgi:pimeloyl-ACP methyl ester carboxylesterase